MASVGTTSTSLDSATVMETFAVAPIQMSASGLLICTLAPMTGFPFAFVTAILSRLESVPSYLRSPMVTETWFPTFIFS